MVFKGNKGEWSELLVFTKLLAEGKLYQSDMLLNKNESEFYEVLKVYREESPIVWEYIRDKDIKLYRVIDQSKELVCTLSVEYFLENAETLFNGIVAGKGKSFGISEVSEFIETAKIKKLKALSSSKTDIKLRIYDHRLAKEADLGFSIKSLIGKNSTLFNPGEGNNFSYKLEANIEFPLSDFNKDTYSPPKRISKITARLQKLIELGKPLKFYKIHSPQLWRNLKMVDGDLPEILAFCLLYKYLYRVSAVNKISDLLEKNDPLNFYDGEQSSQKMYEYKLKKFLAESAMGMTSKTQWDGIYDATGGVIIAKKNKDIVCFHIYDLNLLREYLIQNTYFDQPSTGEDETNPGKPRTDKTTKKYFYGWLDEYQGTQFLDISLQVRFNQ